MVEVGHSLDRSLRPQFAIGKAQKVEKKVESSSDASVTASPDLYCV